MRRARTGSSVWVSISTGRRVGWAVCVLVAMATSLWGTPESAAAQGRVGTSRDSFWPASWSAPPPSIDIGPPSRQRTVPVQPSLARTTPSAHRVLSDGSQVARLPVYDALGQVIPLEEIQVRVDMSGLRGAFWAGLALSSLGTLLGAVLVDYDCNETRGGYHYPCSPREDAMQGAVPLTGFLLGATLGVWIGWEADRTTWQEALTEIREIRRTGVRP